MNAFQLMSSALDISAMFEARPDTVTRATRFTTKAPPADVLATLEQAVASRGGRVQRKDEARHALVVSRLVVHAAHPCPW